MKTVSNSPRVWLARGLEGALAGVLVLAGGLKLVDPARFAAEIAGFRLVEGWLAGGLAVYLPWLEVAVAVGLVFGQTRGAARVLAGVLLAGFSLVLASAWLRGLDVRCGCFGGADPGALAAGLGRNAVLLLVLGVATALRRGGADQPD